MPACSVEDNILQLPQVEHNCHVCMSFMSEADSCLSVT